MTFIDRTSFTSRCLAVVVGLSLILSAFPASFFDFGFTFARAATTTVTATVMAAPANTSSEYITLSNTGSVDVDLSELQLHEAIGELYTFPVSTVLTPGATYTLCKSGGDAETDYGVSCDGTFSGSLNNSGETLSFYASDGTTLLAGPEAIGDPGSDETVEVSFTLEGVPVPPENDEAPEVDAIFECWEPDPENDGKYIAHFGYENNTGVEQSIPFGPNNTVTPNSYQSYFPETFAENADGPRVGRTDFYPDTAIQIPNWDGSSIVWELPNGTETASLNEQLRCPEPEVEPISPILECVETLDEESYRAHFGWENPNEFEVVIPVGDANKFTGGGTNDQDQGQTTVFSYPAPAYPNDDRMGRTGFYPNNAFSVDFDGSNLVWTLNGKTSTASAGSQACPVPEPEAPEVCSFDGEVVSYTDPEFQNDGDLVEANRRLVSAIEAGVAPYANFFGQEANDWQVNPLDFFSLGIGGELVYEFTDKVAVDQPGADIAVWEITGGTANEQTEEQVHVYLSADGVNFEMATTLTGDGTVDIADTSLAYVKFVKLVDNSAGVQGGNGDGYDLDAITIIDGACQDFSTLIAHKIVCADESELPNWGANGPNIDADTAADWVATHNSCEFARGWEFQWGPKSSYDPGDTLVGEADDPWTTFGTTDAAGMAMTLLTEADLEKSSNLWFREVLQEGYIPFTYQAEGNKNTDDFSAEVYCHTDVKNYDNYDRIDGVEAGETYYCVAWNVPQASGVTMCKYDDEQNPLAGWTLMLNAGKIGDYVVPANDAAGVDTDPLAAGVSHYVVANGTWDNNRGPLNVVDAEYSTEDDWVTVMDGFNGFGTDILELSIDGEVDPLSNWGPYNALHEYAQAFVPTVAGPVNLAINDSFYGDNTGSLNASVYQGFAGVTGDNGCVTFRDVPYGEYVAAEVMQPEWSNVSGLGSVVVDEETEQFDVVNLNLNKPAVTIVATKIVCEDENDLPNWNRADDITAETAVEWLAANENSSCRLASDWEFEWGPENAPDAGDTTTGPAGGVWNTFGPTNEVGVATATIPGTYASENDHFWFREVLKPGYLAFSHEADTGNGNDVTAELYCHTDGRNFDNHDRIDDPTSGETYYCVAFNVPTKPLTCEYDINLLANPSFELDTVTNSNGWELFDDLTGWHIEKAEGGIAKAELQAGVNGWVSAAGDQHLELGSNQATQVSQMVATIVGQEYTLSWQYAARPDRDKPESRMRVYVDGVEVATNNEHGGDDETEWTTHSATFTATNVLTEILFVDEGRNNSLGPFLDDTALRCGAEPVEPETFITITGTKFNASTSEGIPEWEITALNEALNLFATTSTDGTGAYSFVDLPADSGEWVIVEVEQANWTQFKVEQNGDQLEATGCTFGSDNDSQSQIENDTVCDFYNTFTGPGDTGGGVDDDDDNNSNDSNNNNNGGDIGSVISFSAAEADRRVLGAATTSFCPFLEDHMQIGWENNPWEVIKLQLFLSMVMGYDNPITGVFDRTTDLNVKAFQEVYRSETLTPWFEAGIVPHDRPTGFVYKTTKWKINDIVCPGDPFPSLDGENLRSNIDTDHGGA